MEDTLGDRMDILCTGAYFAVLILVLMEDTLGDYGRQRIERRTSSLNPCFNGRYSRSN